MVDKGLTLGEQLRMKREDRRASDPDYSQENIAARLGRGFSQPTLSKIERGYKPAEELHPRDLQRLLDAYGFTSLEVAELADAYRLELFGEQPHLSSFQTDTQVPLQEVPVYPAGTGPAWELDDVMDVVGVPASVAPGVRKIGLRAMSNSMTPYLPKGAVAVVALDDGMVKPGDFCGVWLHDAGVVVKRFVREAGNELLLESLNPEPGEERIFVAPLGSRIMGKVVKRVMDG